MPPICTLRCALAMRRSSAARSIGLATLSVSQNAWIEMRGTGRSMLTAAISLSRAASSSAGSYARLFICVAPCPGSVVHFAVSAEIRCDRSALVQFDGVGAVLGIDLRRLARAEQVVGIRDLRGEVVLI